MIRKMKTGKRKKQKMEEKIKTGSENAMEKETN